MLLCFLSYLTHSSHDQVQCPTPHASNCCISYIRAVFKWPTPTCLPVCVNKPFFRRASIRQVAESQLSDQGKKCVHLVARTWWIHCISGPAFMTWTWSDSSRWSLMDLAQEEQSRLNLALTVNCTPIPLSMSCQTVWWVRGHGVHDARRPCSCLRYKVLWIQDTL